MLLNSNEKVKVTVKRSYALVYDINGVYYNRFPLGNDCDLKVGDYVGYPIFDYITYKDKKTGSFNSFIVLCDIDLD